MPDIPTAQSVAWDAVCTFDCLRHDLKAVTAIANLMATSELDEVAQYACRGIEDLASGIDKQMQAHEARFDAISKAERARQTASNSTNAATSGG